MGEYPAPKITATAYGKFLAVSPKSYQYRIGVIGDTIEDAALQFNEAVERWESLGGFDEIEIEHQRDLIERDTEPYA